MRCVIRLDQCEGGYLWHFVVTLFVGQSVQCKCKLMEIVNLSEIGMKKTICFSTKLNARE